MFWQRCRFLALPHGVTHSPLGTGHLCLDPAVDHLQGASGLSARLLFPVPSLWPPCQHYFSPPCFLSPPTPSPVTVVCYQADRDELRRRVIQWLEAEIIPDGWFSKGSNYSEVLDKYFKASRACPRGRTTFLGQPWPRGRGCTGWRCCDGGQEGLVYPAAWCGLDK